ncbi:hypothetical protein HDR66_03420 [bacterium]|nr:hypothetical protein [bacterium]
MNALKKFWIVFLSFLPLSAGAIAPFLVVGGIAGVTSIVGFSIFRTTSPVNMSDALQFFSSCWTCQMFSSVMSTMSELLPRAYHAIGMVVIPFAAILSAVWFAWRLFSGFMAAKIDNPWDVTGEFGIHLMKLALVCGLLMAPLPRMISDIAITPVFNVGLSMNNIVSDTDARDSFSTCVIATTLSDPTISNEQAVSKGAFSPNLRSSLACQVASVHQMTGLGMTIGWTMMNMAFNSQYMHKILWDIPIFPNIPIFFFGLMILVLYFFALLPIPVFFLEVFIELSMDLIMLPLMILGWLFKGWKIFPSGGRTVGKMFDDVVRATLGIAITCIFIKFSVMFLTAMFGSWGGASRLAIALDKNDSRILMDGIMMRNDSIVTILLMGLFIAMFMTMIPALVKTLFKVEISTTMYDTIKKDLKTMQENLKKWYATIKK